MSLKINIEKVENQKLEDEEDFHSSIRENIKRLKLNLKTLRQTDEDMKLTFRKTPKVMITPCTNDTVDDVDDRDQIIEILEAHSEKLFKIVERQNTIIELLVNEIKELKRST